MAKAIECSLEAGWVRVKDRSDREVWINPLQITHIARRSGTDIYDIHVVGDRDHVAAVEGDVNMLLLVTFNGHAQRMRQPV